MDLDKAGLMALTTVPIKMADTSFGWFSATQKRDAEQAYQHIGAAEREAFLQRLTEINATQTPPSNLTPVRITYKNQNILPIVMILLALVQLSGRQLRQAITV